MTAAEIDVIDTVFSDGLVQRAARQLHLRRVPDLGPGAVRNEALDALHPGEALLVQVFGQDDDGVAA